MRATAELEEATVVETAAELDTAAEDAVATGEVELETPGRVTPA